MGTRFMHSREECACEVRTRELRDEARRMDLARRVYISESGIKGELAGYRLAQIQNKPKEGLVPAGFRGKVVAVGELKAIAQRYIDGFPDDMPRVLLLSGSVGCGKTHVACSIANALLDMPYQVRYVNMVKLWAMLPQTWSRGKDESKPSDPIPGLLDATLLIMDELEKLTKDWQTAELYRIINGRYESGKPYIVTTNICSMEDMRAAIGDKIMDRLLHRAEWYFVDATSHRLAEFAGGAR